MKKLILLLSIVVLFSSCERCWECEEKHYYCQELSTYPMDGVLFPQQFKDTLYTKETYCQKFKPKDRVERSQHVTYNSSAQYTIIIERLYCIKK